MWTQTLFWIYKQLFLVHHLSLFLHSKVYNSLRVHAFKFGTFKIRFNINRWRMCVLIYLLNFRTLTNDFDHLYPYWLSKNQELTWIIDTWKWTEFPDTILQFAWKIINTRISSRFDSIPFRLSNIFKRAFVGFCMLQVLK